MCRITTVKTDGVILHKAEKSQVSGFSQFSLFFFIQRACLTVTRPAIFLNTLSQKPQRRGGGEYYSNLQDGGDTCGISTGDSMGT